MTIVGRERPVDLFLHPCYPVGIAIRSLGRQTDLLL